MSDFVRYCGSMPPGTRRCFVLWVCLLMKLMFYASFVPLWEGYDEFAHFAFVQHLAGSHGLPNLQNAGISREVADSLRFAPVPWTIRQWKPGWITHDDFWRLPPDSRRQRARDLKEIPPSLAWDPESDLRLYEAQQPPLAYLLDAFPYAAFQSTDLLTRAWIVRIAGCAIASLVVPLGFLLARRVFTSAALAVAAVAVVVSMPEFMMTADHGGNEPLAIVLGTACVYCLCSLAGDSQRPLRRTLLLGFLLGCGLLTKAYFLTMIPAIAVVYAMRFRRRVTGPLLVTMATAALIAGWWYVRALHTTGTLTGGQIAIAARQSTAPFSQAMSGIDWFRVADFALVSHIWLGGWSFLVLRTWMYRIVEFIFLAACTGLLYRCRYTRLPATFLPRPLTACLSVQLCFWAGMMYYAWSTWLATGEAAVLGYYACALAVPEAVCLICGLPARRFTIPAVVVVFAAIELYGTVFCLMPYYAGLTAHSLRGSVPAMQASRLLNGGLAELFRNLAVNKPDFLPAGALFALWAGFLLAIVGVIAVSLSLAFSQLDKSGSRAPNGLVPLGPR